MFKKIIAVLSLVIVINVYSKGMDIVHNVFDKINGTNSINVEKHLRSNITKQLSEIRKKSTIKLKS